MLHPTTVPTAASAMPSELSHRVHRVGALLALLVAALGTVIVAGWLAGERRLAEFWLPGVSPVRPMGGVALVVLGVALALAHRRGPSRLTLGLGAVVGVFAALSIADRALNLDIGMDRFLAPHGLGLPDGVPVGVATTLLLLAASLILARRDAQGELAQWLAMAALAIAATLTLIAIELGAAGAGAPPFSQVSGALLSGLAFSAVLLRPDARPLAPFFGPLPSSRILRWALVLTLLVPLLLTLVINVLGEWGLWQSEYADAFITGGAMILLLALVLYGGTRLVHAEERSLLSMERLLDAAERVRELYDEAPTGYVSLDASGELTEVNATLCEWVGRPQAALIGRRLADLATDATRPALLDAFEALRLGHVIEDFDFDLDRDAGEPLAVGMRADPRRDDDGTLRLVRVTLFDATLQREADRARRKADARYREIVETANEGIWTLDAGGRLTFVNPRIAELLGAAQEDLIGRPVTDFLAEDERAAWLRHDVDREGDPGGSAELRLRRIDGGTVWVLLASTTLRGDDGRPVGALGMLTDVTARRDAERSVRENQRRFQLLVDENPSGLAIKDLDLRYTVVNRAFAAMAGVPAEELIGRRATDVEAFGQASETAKLQRRAIELRRPIREERRLAQPTGDQVRLNTYFPLLNMDGEPTAVCVMTTDISELKAMEGRLADLNRELEARVASRTRELEAANRDLASFASTVAHDLRAPLRTISGFSTIVLEEYREGLPDQARHYLDLVSRGASEMSELIDDLLTFARTGREDVERREVDPGAVVHEVLADITGDEPTEGVDLVIAPDLPVCLADPRLLRIVLQNLLANALKFTRGREHRRVEVGWTAGENGEVTYWVRDDGVGFDQAQAGRLFSMFQRLHPADEFEGTGLGLAIVERVIHRHGGHVAAVGEPDAGATLSFSLGPEDALRRRRLAQPVG